MYKKYFTGDDPAALMSGVKLYQKLLSDPALEFHTDQIELDVTTFNHAAMVQD